MTLEDAKKEAQVQADKAGYQLIVVKDPIGNAEDYDGPYGYFPTLALVMNITTLKHGGSIEQVIEPKKSQKDRRADLENGLIELFRKDPNLIKSFY